MNTESKKFPAVPVASWEKEQAKHTPGPWLLFFSGTSAIIQDENGCTIAECPKYGVGVVTNDQPAPWHLFRDNARLIAAVPDLLEACKDLEAIASLINGRQHAGASIRPDYWSELYHCCNQAQAAIQKATGAQ